ncbi:MAG TPA: substrate-binding domain-containing protein [Pseudonocardiaceae bacterium]|nr:substrate-binding domain-containing protein [Pseudonocardiaceae bacterium]
MRISGKFLIPAVLGAVSALFLAGCSTTPTVTNSGSNGPSHSKVIAFLMPCSTCAARFETKDKPYFIQAVHALDPSITVIANNAQGSGDTQLAQAESALSNGAGVVVTSPMTDQAGAAIVAKANAQNASVIAYDGMIMGAKPNAYVSFDNELVGRLQGQYLADHLAPGSTVVMLNGDPSSAPGEAFKKGAHDVLDPLFSAGKLKLGYEADDPSFDPNTGQQKVEQALTQLNDNVQAVLTPNDGLAQAAITALTARQLNGKVLVTGQDASDSGLQQVIEGNQSMTVYKPILQEAQAAAKIAVDLLDGKSGDVGSIAAQSTNNGTADIPSVLLQPVVVTKDNIASTVIAQGFTTRQSICTGPTATTCPF